MDRALAVGMISSVTRQRRLADAADEAARAAMDAAADRSLDDAHLRAALAEAASALRSAGIALRTHSYLTEVVAAAITTPTGPSRGSS